MQELSMDEWKEKLFAYFPEEAKKLEEMIGPLHMTRMYGIEACGFAKVPCLLNKKLKINVACNLDVYNPKDEEPECGLTEGMLDSLRELLAHEEDVMQMAMKALWQESYDNRVFLMEHDENLTFNEPKDLLPFFLNEDGTMGIQIPYDAEVGEPEFGLSGGYELDEEHGFSIWIKNWQITSVSGSSDPNFNNFKWG